MELLCYLTSRSIRPDGKNLDRQLIAVLEDHLSAEVIAGAWAGTVEISKALCQTTIAVFKGAADVNHFVVEYCA